MIINYNVPVKQEMCPARLARQEYCFIKINKSLFFLDPQPSYCPSCLDVAPRDYPTISNPLGLFVNISSRELCH